MNFFLWFAWVFTKSVVCTRYVPKLFVLKDKFSEFAMKKDESIAEMFNRLNDIVNDLKGLGFEVLLTLLSAPDLYTASARFCVAFPLEYSPKVYQSTEPKRQETIY